MSPPPHLVVLTPSGRGAVASLLVAGSAAGSLVDRFFQPAGQQPISAAPIGRVLFGHWGRGPGEEVVVCKTAGQQVEIHCHGGRAAVEAIADALVAAGCRMISWQQWTASWAEPLAAEALGALAMARTQRAAGILLDQLQGALAAELRQIAALLEQQPGIDHAGAAERLQRLLASSRLGLRLSQGFKVVLAGRPNVGKSSLINALLGYERAIVFDQPGTTRDVLRAPTALDGWPIELADTAGLSAAGNSIEQSAMELSAERLAGADARVLVFDASRPWTAADAELLDRWSDALVVHNKSDLPPADGPPRPAGLHTSAAARSGVDELARLLASRLVPCPPAPGTAVVFTDRQHRAIEQAQRALAAGQPSDALSLVGDLLCPPKPGPP